VNSPKRYLLNADQVPIFAVFDEMGKHLLRSENIILQAPVVREEEWLQQNMGLARISKIDKTALMQAELMYQDET
jgi:hypothetical protein